MLPAAGVGAMKSRREADDDQPLRPLLDPGQALAERHGLRVVVRREDAARRVDRRRVQRDDADHDKKFNERKPTKFLLRRIYAGKTFIFYIHNCKQN